MATTPEFDVLSPDFFRDPFATLSRMRDEAPVYYVAPLKSWFITRHEDIDFLVKDARFSAARAAVLLGASGLLADDDMSRKMLDLWSRLIFAMDEPRHTQIRTIANKGLTPASLEGLRPMVASVVRDALAAAHERREMDVAVELADPIALNVITEMFAVPVEDRDQFRTWTTDVMKPGGAGVGSEDVGRRVRQSSSDLQDYMMSLANERRKNPGSDMVSRLVSTEGIDPEIAEDVAFQCVQLVGAGYVTSANQITNSVLTFLRHPDELQKLRDDPGLLRNAVEETLRYEPAVLSINRLCTEDVELHGAQIKKGELAFGIIASASRDPSVFPDPDRFDIHRKGLRHLTFGSGHHYCIGATLARIELEEALRALLAFPRWELGDKPCEYGSYNLQDRAPKTLDVRFPRA